MAHHFPWKKRPDGGDEDPIDSPMHSICPVPLEDFSGMLDGKTLYLEEVLCINVALDLDGKIIILWIR